MKTNTFLIFLAFVLERCRGGALWDCEKAERREEEREGCCVCE